MKINIVKKNNGAIVAFMSSDEEAANMQMLSVKAIYLV